MNETIASIYRAAAGAQPWDDALANVANALGVMGSQMLGVSSDTGAVLFSHAAAGAPSDAELDYLRLYHAVDPRIPLLMPRQPGEWLYDQDVFDDEIGVTNPYYREFLIPHGARYSASVKLLNHEGEITLVTFIASLGSAGFSDASREVLATFGFHLREAAALYKKTRSLLASSLAGSALMNRMTRPAFLLSVDQSVSFMNGAARAHLSSHRNLALRRDRLVATHPDSQAALEEAFAVVLSRLSTHDHLRRPIIRLGAKGSATAMAASLTSLQPQQTMYAFGNLPQILLLVHASADQTREPDVLLWEAAFDLTPAQSRVALQIFRGRTLKEASRALQVAESTVRSHLNEVYAKTNTRRLAELVLRLAALNE